MFQINSNETARGIETLLTVLNSVQTAGVVTVIVMLIRAARRLGSFETKIEIAENEVSELKGKTDKLTEQVSRLLGYWERSGGGGRRP